MSFSTDQQTLNDLNILSNQGSASVYSLYNQTLTRGGAELLETMFRYPLPDAAAINNRSRTLQYFGGIMAEFPFNTAGLDSIELYLSLTDPRTKLTLSDNSLVYKVTQYIATAGEEKMIIGGIAAIISIVHDLDAFINTITSTAALTPYRTELEELQLLAGSDVLARLKNEKKEGKLQFTTAVELDEQLRFRSASKISQLLNLIYKLDVYIAVAGVAAKRGYIFPEALASDEPAVRVKGLYHPLVESAVDNKLYITPQSHIVFLTGANMAGKSTFMKSLGIALYLAHMGFPVAASHMEFSVCEGIYTTINLPDDLNSGNSHFYAEVLRLKKIAKEIGAKKNLFVIFDELFRGTNVKDACEGTIAVTRAFAEKQNCMFMLSTHITEAGQVLQGSCPNINFVCLPTQLDGNRPVYTYKMEQGITADRHGMVIINNERILEIIRSRQNKTITP